MCYFILSVIQVVPITGMVSLRYVGDGEKLLLAVLSAILSAESRIFDGLTGSYS